MKSISLILWTKFHVELVFTDSVELKLICSNAFCSPEQSWMDQSETEWVLVLRGSAQLRFQGDGGVMDLSPGDHLFIPPHRLHRVERSDPDPGTLWLALYWNA